MKYRYEVHNKGSEFVIVNKTLNTHAHLPNKRGVKAVFKILRRKIPLNQIKESYLRESIERLEPRIHKKQRYKNFKR